MVTYLSQLSQMGVFKKVNGILLGTFTKMEADDCQPDMAKRFLNSQKKRHRCETLCSWAWHRFKGNRIGHHLKLYSGEADKIIYKGLR